MKRINLHELTSWRLNKGMLVCKPLAYNQGPSISKYGYYGTGGVMSIFVISIQQPVLYFKKPTTKKEVKNKELHVISLCTNYIKNIRLAIESTCKYICIESTEINKHKNKLQTYNS